MAAAFQNIATSSRSRVFQSVSACAVGSRIHFLKCSHHFQMPPSWKTLRKDPPSRQLHFPAAFQWEIRAFPSGGGFDGSLRRELQPDSGLDALLPVAEVLCIVPSAVMLIGCVLNWVLLSSKKSLEVSLMNRCMICQLVLLLCAIGIGAVIRRRQWRRICMNLPSSSEGDPSTSLVTRVSKLEEDLGSSVTMIRVLSRQLEKLGLRFRVTRRNLKDPIAETAVLAQKNSEATRTLAKQEEILEKELGEIQKVLLAMQDQQQKQLELILAIGTPQKPLEKRRDSTAEGRKLDLQNSALKREHVLQTKVQTERHGSQK